MSLLRTQGLSLAYGDKLALDQLTLDLEEGRIHAIVGANGAGKSSLFRILLGFEAPQAGSATLFGHDCQQLPLSDRARIGFVDDSHALPGWMRVGAITAMQQRQYPNWKQAAYDAILDQFELHPAQQVSELSRGQRAGLNLALALAQDPALLILDEPTLGLDLVAKRSFLDALMFSHDASRMTVLYASHHIDEIDRVADNLVLIERGRLRHVGPVDAFRDRVSTWLVEFSGAATLLAQLPGVREARPLDGQVLLTVFDAMPDFAERLQAAGARASQSQAATLEQAISGMLRAANRSTANA